MKDSSVPEFQAVVLAAGKGSRFTDLTNSVEKCLLPVGNKPMLWYPLLLLSRLGFTDVIVIAPESARGEVSSLPKKHGLTDLRLDVFTLTPGQASELGTAEALSLVHDKIKAERVMVVAGDLYTDLPMHNLTSLHRIHNAGVTALFSKAAADQRVVPVPGPKRKPKKERDFVGIEESTKRLCFLSSEADLEEFVTIRRSLLQEHPRIGIFTDLQDAHLYIMERWVLDFLKRNESIASIKGELLPILVKKQFSRSNNQAADSHIEDDDSQEHKRDDKDILSFVPHDPMESQAECLSSWNDHSGDLNPAYRGHSLRCYAYVQDGGCCVRINTMSAYCEANRLAAPGGKLSAAALLQQPSGKEPPAAAAAPVHPKAQVMERAQVGSECLLGEDCVVSGKTTLKHSTVGAHCAVAEKTKLTNSLLMNSVQVGEGCNVSGSILCEGVRLPERVELKDCIVARGFECQPGAKHVNEVLSVQHERIMEI